MDATITLGRGPEFLSKQETNLLTDQSETGLHHRFRNGALAVLNCGGPTAETLELQKRCNFSDRNQASCSRQSSGASECSRDRFCRWEYHIWTPGNAIRSLARHYLPSSF